MSTVSVRVNLYKLQKKVCQKVICPEDTQLTTINSVQTEN